MKQIKTLFEPLWKPFRKRFDKLDKNNERQFEELAAVQTELIKNRQVIGELGDNLDNLQDELEKLNVKMDNIQRSFSSIESLLTLSDASDEKLLNVTEKILKEVGGDSPKGYRGSE